MAQSRVILPEQQLNNRRGPELAQQEGLEIPKSDAPARQQNRRRRRGQPHLGRVAIAETDLTGPQQALRVGEEAHP